METISPQSKQFKLGGELPINRLGFGAMRLANNGWDGPPRDPEVGRAVLRRAIELGVNHIDTADFYRSRDGILQANNLIREALYPYPSGLVIATKVGPSFGPNGPFYGPAEGLRSHVEANLTALRLQRLDLVYLRIGMMTPPHGESLAERFEVLAKLQQEGLIRHLGISNVDAAHLEEARAIAPVAAIQNHFNVTRQDDVGLLETCGRNGIAFVPYGPIGSGNGDISSDHLIGIANRHHATIQQVALAWLLRLSSATLAIPGTGSINHLEQNMASASVVLTDEDIAELS